MLTETEANALDNALQGLRAAEDDFCTILEEKYRDFVGEMTDDPDDNATPSPWSYHEFFFLHNPSYDDWLVGHRYAQEFSPFYATYTKGRGAEVGQLFINYCAATRRIVMNESVAGNSQLNPRQPIMSKRTVSALLTQLDEAVYNRLLQLAKMEKAHLMQRMQE